MIYVAAFILSLFFLHLYVKSKVNIFLMLAMIPLTLLSGLRYKVGTDYIDTYQISFYAIKNGFNVDGYDYGFTLLNKAILAFSNEPQFLFFLTSIIIGIFVFGAIKSSVNPELSLYIYVCSGMYFMGMNQVKQFLGMALCLYSIKLFFEKKIILFSILQFVAVSFHTANAIFLLPFIFMRFPKIEKILSPRIIAPSLVAIGILSSVVANVLFDKILIYSRFYDRYSDSDYVTSNFSWAYFIMNLYGLICFFYLYKLNKENKKYQLFYIFKILSLFLVVLSSQFWLAARLSDVLFIVDILSLPFLCSLIQKNKVRIVAQIGIVFLFGYYVYWSMFLLNNHSPFPYQYRLPYLI